MDIRALSKRAAITPAATHGTLNDVTAHKLIYDAVTTSGGSGGPVFGPDGEVIGVNFAILRDFTGSNFGVPIRLVRPLIPWIKEYWVPGVLKGVNRTGKRQLLGCLRLAGVQRGVRR